jgi:hypothetical protein
MNDQTPTPDNEPQAAPAPVPSAFAAMLADWDKMAEVIDKINADLKAVLA